MSHGTAKQAFLPIRTSSCKAPVTSREIPGLLNQRSVRISPFCERKDFRVEFPAEHLSHVLKSVFPAQFCNSRFGKSHTNTPGLEVSTRLCCELCTDPQCTQSWWKRSFFTGFSKMQLQALFAAKLCFVYSQFVKRALSRRSECVSSASWLGTGTFERHGHYVEFRVKRGASVIMCSVW